jgi:rhamnosyltransferase
MTVPEGGTAVPRCTVILRCKNSEREIGIALAALFSQDFRDFELLVIDSGSTDRTLEIVAAWPHRLIRIAPGDYVPGRVLNRGASENASPVCVFLNSDCVLLSPGSLGSLVGAFDEPAVMAAFARQVARPEAWPWVRREYRESFPEAGKAAPWIELSLPFAAMRRSAWEEQPFYDEAWGSEDTAWGHRARERGWGIAYVPGALVMHSHNYTFKQLFGRRFIEGEADSFIYGKVDRPFQIARRAIGNILRDWAADVREGRLADIPVAPFRRFVDARAYLKGARHGRQRRETGEADISHGQKTVLDRHVSKR